VLHRLIASSKLRSGTNSNPGDWSGAPLWKRSLQHAFTERVANRRLLDGTIVRQEENPSDLSPFSETNSAGPHWLPGVATARIPFRDLIGYDVSPDRTLREDSLAETVHHGEDARPRSPLPVIESNTAADWFH
jgi:hypothetical protein